MLYFGLTVFILLNGLAVKQMFQKHVVQFTSTTEWCFYKNKCYSSNLICSKLTNRTKKYRHMKEHTQTQCYIINILGHLAIHTLINIYTPEVMLHLISKLKNSTCASRFLENF